MTMRRSIAIGISLVVLGIFIGLAAFLGSINLYPDWFGLGSSTETTTTTKGTDVTTSVKEQGAKTVWDWGQLLFVPVVLVIGGYLLNQSTQERATRQETAQREKETAQATAQRREREEQERRAERRVLLQKIYLDLIQEYNAAKRVRRLLRATARCLPPNQNDSEKIMIMTAPYDKQMQILIGVQLQFETFIDQVDSNPTLFSTQTTNTLKTELSCIEKYVNDIIGEYEDLYKINPDTTSQLASIDKLPKLKEFIGKYSYADRFKEDFKHPAHEVMRILLDILNSPEIKG